MEQYVIDEIERYLDGKGAEIPFATGSDIGKAVDYAAGRNRYIGYLISLALTLIRVCASALTAQTEARG